MKKILTTLFIFTASFMLLLTVSNKAYAYEETESFAFEIYNMNSVVANPGLYNYLVDLTDGYGYGQMQHVTVDISLLDYNTAYLEKNLNGFNLIFTSDTDSYEFGIDASGDIEVLGDPVADDEYSLTFKGLNNAYQDLFYENIEINTTINGVEGKLEPNIYDELLQYSVVTNDTDLNGDFKISNVTIYVNDVIVSDDTHLTKNTYGDIFYIGDRIEWTYFISINEDNIGIDEGFVDGDTIKIIFKLHKSWTQAHDYGRIRTNSSTLYLNQVSDTVAFLSHSESTNGINVTNIAVGDEVVMQSPYTDFSVSYGNLGFPRNYLVEQENIAAVRMIKNTSDNTNYTFILFYWENGSVVSRTVNNINLANRNSLNIKFDGGFRKALDGTAAAVASLDENYDVNVFISELSAWDDIDGDISDQIYIIEDNYTPNIGTIGAFTVLVGVMDSEEQESTLLLTITVMDLTAPTGPSTNTVTAINYTSTFNLNDYISTYIRANFTDNYNDPEDLVITVKTDNYTPNKTTTGNKTVVFEVKDTSGNKVEHTLTIPVIDQVAPQFTAGVQTLSKSINEIITVAQLVATQTVMDAIDGNVSSSIIIVSDNYTANAYTPGTYEVILRAFDSSNNQVTRTITINVFSGVPGWYIPNDGPLIIPDGTVLTEQQLESVLLSVGWLSDDVPYTFISSNYFENSGTPGTYTISYMIGGQQTTFNLLVLNQGDNWFPDVPNQPVQTGLSNGWIIGLVAVGVLGAAGLVYYLYKKKK